MSLHSIMWRAGVGLATLALIVLVVLAGDLNRQMLLAALAAGLFAGALLGWWIAKREPRPAVHIAAAPARNILLSRVGDRVDLAKAPAELEELVKRFNQMFGECLTDCARSPQLHQLARAFNTMIEKLEESFLRLSDFSSDLAHELRTPVHSLMVRTQVALSKPRSADEYREALEANVEEMERLARLIADILFLARADQAQAVLRREDFNIREEVDKVSVFFEPLAEEHGLRIERTGSAVIHADRTLIERVISNLLSNALRYSGPDGIVRAAIGNSDGRACLEVTNSGPGISAKDQLRVFDRFFQVDRSRSQHGDGSGLGLVIVKSIMELHGGSVSVRSSLDGPTTFTVAFSAHPTR